MMVGCPQRKCRISVDDLHRAFELLLTHLRQTAGAEVSLRHEMFWTVSASEMYDIHERPSELTIGQLSESWEHVQKLVERGDAELAYELVWFADVLRAIGHQQISQNATARRQTAESIDDEQRGCTPMQLRRVRRTYDFSRDERV